MGRSRRVMSYYWQAWIPISFTKVIVTVSDENRYEVLSLLVLMLLLKVIKQSTKKKKKTVKATQYSYMLDFYSHVHWPCAVVSERPGWRPAVCMCPRPGGSWACSAPCGDSRETRLLQVDMGIYCMLHIQYIQSYTLTFFSVVPCCQMKAVGVTVWS